MRRRLYIRHRLVEIGSRLHHTNESRRRDETHRAGGGTKLTHGLLLLRGLLEALDRLSRRSIQLASQRLSLSTSSSELRGKPSDVGVKPNRLFTNSH